MAREYITTLSQLEEVKLADLGAMNEKTYDAFVVAAQEAASAKGVTNPKIIVGLKFKPGAHPMGLVEYPYPIIADEWSTFLRDATKMCEFIPHVYVVDGNAFTAPI